MKPYNYLTRSVSKFAFVAVALLASQAAHANLNFVLSEFVDGVMLSGSGSFDQTDLIVVQTPGPGTPHEGGLLVPSFSVGVVGNGLIGVFDAGSPTSGPSLYGTGDYIPATNGTGDAFGFDFAYGDAFLLLPQGYLANNPLAGTGFYEGETFASLGVTPGSYQWVLSDDQTITLTVVPEPATTGLLVALSACGFVGLRRRFYGKSEISLN